MGPLAEACVRIATAIAVIVSASILLYVGQTLNLPEEIAWLVGVSVAIGAVTGRWAIVSSAVAMLGIPLFVDNAGDEDWRLAMIAYLPIVAASLGFGVALHRVARGLGQCLRAAR